MFGTPGRVGLVNSSSFSPASLFYAGEQGVWYDPSDFSTMFQDSAGTTPVTAVEQPVGKILDKSGRGNHATQATSASRPVLSARYNLLTKTEAFDDAAWTTTSTTISPNSTTDPVGGNTADALLEAIANSFHSVRQTSTVVVAASGLSYTFKVYIKANSRTKGYLSVVSGGGYSSFDLTAKTNSFGGNGTNETVTAQTLTELTNGWFLLSITSVFSGVANINPVIGILNDAGASSYIGDVTKGFYIWGADLRVTNDGVSLPAYQRVNTSTDYDTVGFPAYLKFDGVDDSLATGSIDFSATDKMSVFAGVRKLSDAAQGVLIESGLDATSASYPGSLVIYAPSAAASANYQFIMRGGTGRAFETLTTYTSPVSNVLAFSLINQLPASGEAITSRINGVLNTATESNNITVSGNYGNYPLYIGRRGGSTLPYNGRIYSLIVRGAASSDMQIVATEDWIEAKTFGKEMNYVFTDPLTDVTGDFITSADGDQIYMTVSYQ